MFFMKPLIDYNRSVDESKRITVIKTNLNKNKCKNMRIFEEIRGIVHARFPVST